MHVMITSIHFAAGILINPKPIPKFLINVKWKKFLITGMDSEKESFDMIKNLVN